MDQIKIITIVRDSKPYWKAIDPSTGLEGEGPTPSKAASNLRTKLNKLLSKG